MFILSIMAVSFYFKMFNALCLLSNAIRTHDPSNFKQHEYANKYHQLYFIFLWSPTGMTATYKPICTIPFVFCTIYVGT